MSDGRAQSLYSAGFPVGYATPGDLGQVIPFLLPPLRVKSTVCEVPLAGSFPRILLSSDHFGYGLVPGQRGCLRGSGGR